MVSDDSDQFSDDEYERYLGKSWVDDLVERYATAQMNELAEDVPRSDSPSEAIEQSTYEHRPQAAEWIQSFQLQTQMDQLRSLSVKSELEYQKLSKRKQVLNQRTVFFYWAVCAISIVLFANTWFFWKHLVATNFVPRSEVMMGWLTTSLIEVIGLGYIIARSLFKNASGTNSNGSNGANGSRASTL